MLSCNEKTIELGNENFPTQTSLNIYQQKKFSDVAYTKLFRLNNGDFLATLTNDNYFFGILDANLNLKKRIIDKTNPTDTLPDDFETSSFSTSDYSFSFILNDINSGEILKLFYNLNNDEYSLEKISKYPIEYNLAHVFMLDDTKILGNVMNLDFEMDIIRMYDFSSDSSKPEKVIPIPFSSNKNYSDDILLYRFNTLFTSHLRKLDDNTFVYALPDLREIVVFNEDLDIKHKIPTPFEQPQIDNYMNNKDGSNIMEVVKYIGVTKSHIIVYCKDKSNDKTKSSLNSFLLYDHALQPKAKLEIKQELYSFEIDTENNLIYGIDFKNEDVYIYKTEFSL